MYTRWSVLACLSVSLCAAALTDTAHAAALPVPTVEYSADRVVETEAGTFAGKVYSAKDKERAETSMQGMQSVMILRRDQQLGWMLMPAQKMYQQIDFAKAQQQSGAAPDSEVEITQVGSETIEGFDTTKYKMIMKDGSAGGFIWITGEGIAVKMDMLSKSDGKKTRITMTLTEPADRLAGSAAFRSAGRLYGDARHGGVRYRQEQGLWRSGRCAQGRTDERRHVEDHQSLRSRS